MFHRIAERLRSDSGFGLIETVVSMFLLAILAVLFLPLLIQGLKQSSANATMATATQLVNDQIRRAQAAGPICASVEGLEGAWPFSDPRGVTIEVTTDVAECPAGKKPVRVEVTAVRADTSEVLATAATLVLVG